MEDEFRVKFTVDTMLGRLAKWLRILGYDTLYFNISNREELILSSLRDDRIILTRDNKLAHKKILKRLFIESEDTQQQLKQLIKAKKIQIDEDRLFTRCLLCNSPVEDIKKQEVKSRVPEYAYNTQECFSICHSCDKIYWRGSHWDKIIDQLKEVV
ncbi:MAG: Mut7-C RNAse domain-containing protein [bacterium]